MSAALFIITIPTQTEEKRSQTKPKNLHFETPKASNKNILPGKRKVFETPLTPNIKTTDIHYGTFLQAVTPSKHPLTEESAKIIIEQTPEKANSIKTVELTRNESKMKQNQVKIEEQPAFFRSWEGIKDIVTTVRRSINAKKKPQKDSDLQIPPDSSMETVLREILKKNKIENSTWTKSLNETTNQVLFTIECDQRYDLIIQSLLEWGIGQRSGSTVSILPCTAYYSPTKGDESNCSSEKGESYEEKQTTWERFINSMRARLNVVQIVDEVRNAATITFDFVILLSVAAILAAFGLIENSTIFLASSMLISPLMGPIIGATFGTVIKDRSLQKLGVINELFGLFFATIVGFIFGIIVCIINRGYDLREGLTSEMLSRCELHSLWVGILIALPSGAAVAIAILGDNIGSLVGVAISASLLPPAVNAGLLWALSIISMLLESENSPYKTVVQTNIYSDYQSTELAILGLISMCVTLSNIVCIYIMGVIVLKLKEVAPIASRDNRQYWKYNIKIAREMNKSSQDDNIIQTKGNNNESAEMEAMAFNRINLARASYQHTWSPMDYRHAISFLDKRTSIQDFERFYMTMSSAYPDFSKIPMSSLGGPGKVGIWRSPPKYRPFSPESSMAAFPKRQSLHKDFVVSPKYYRNLAYNNNKPDPLEKITEQPATNTKELKTMDCKKIKKFTVVPAPDPMLPNN